MQKWLKMENKSQIKKNKFLTVAVFTLFLLSATAISSASAQGDPTRIPNQTPTDANSELIGENPTLYTAQDNSTTATDDNPIFDRSQDNSTSSPDDNATLYTTQDNLNEENVPLIAPAAQPDNTLTILGIAALATIIAVSAVVAVYYRKKN
jgi:hypothetical protein